MVLRSCFPSHRSGGAYRRISIDARRAGVGDLFPSLNVGGAEMGCGCGRRSLELLWRDRRAFTAAFFSSGEAAAIQTSALLQVKVGETIVA